MVQYVCARARCMARDKCGAGGLTLRRSQTGRDIKDKVCNAMK